jgi:16S rRNA (uracil1498-N3)-methyltransferase
MSIQPRFFVPAARTPGAILPLPEDEAVHLTRVLRLAAGDAIRVFDGRGNEFDAVVETAGKSAAAVRLLNSREAVPEPGIKVTLAQAVLKGDKMDDVIRDAVMLGVAAVQPLVTHRTEVSMASLERGRRVERWQRIAVSAVKQCGRAFVPEVLRPVTFAELANRVESGLVPAPALMLVEPDAAAKGSPITAVARQDQCTLIIGPEGGWDVQELGAAAGCQPITIGGRTIRADAMPLVALSALFATWKEF